MPAFALAAITVTTEPFANARNGWPDRALICAARAPARVLRSDVTGTETAELTPPAVKVTRQVSPTTTGPMRASWRELVAAFSTIAPVSWLLVRAKTLPALGPSVEMVSEAPAATTLNPARGSSTPAKLAASAARSVATVAETVVATPSTVRVTVQTSPTVTGPWRSKLRETEITAAGATLSLVVKATPVWLTTTRLPPSAIARKPGAAPALIAAARPAATLASVLPATA